MPRQKRRGHGEGTIYQLPTGRWRAQLTVGDKRVSKSFGSRADARDWLARAQKIIQDGLPVETSQITVAAYLDRWLRDVVAHRVRPRTLESYEYIVRVHLTPALGAVRLAQLRPDHIQRLCTDATAAGLSSRTVQYIHAVLSRALKQAVRWGLIPRNVCDLTDPPRVRRHEMKTLTPDQARAFLDHVRRDRLYALYLLAITTGMRQGELLGLRWSDVDLAHGRLQVTHSLQSLGGKGMQLSEPKSDAGRRSIILTPVAISALRDHRKAQLEERLRAGGRWRDHDLVFCTANGTPISRHNLRRSFLLHLAHAGLPTIRFHDLRHTAATLMLSQGTHPKVVQEMLGHSQISLTLDTYSHVLPTMQHEAVERMQKLLDG